MAAVYQQNGFWYLDATVNGKRARRILGKVGVLSERDARRLEKQAQLQASVGYGLLNPSAAPTVRQFAAEYLAWHETEHPDSCARIKQLINQHILTSELADLQLSEVKPLAVERYKRMRAAEVGKRGLPAAATIGKEVRTLKALLAKAVEWELIDRHPAKYVAEPKQLESRPPPFYRVDQLAQLYAATVEPWHSHAWRLFVNTGLRRGEAMALKSDWIVGDRLNVVSAGEERTKSGHWRQVPLNVAAQNALKALGTAEGGYVLPRVARESLSRAFIIDAQRAGIGGSLHWLRHTYATHLVANGIDVQTVKAVLGHSTIRVTEQYLHVLGSRLERVTTAVSL